MVIKILNNPKRRELSDAIFMCGDTALSLVLKLIEYRNWMDDYRNGYKCAQYVFGTVMKEPWSDAPMPADFWKHTKRFLFKNNYISVKEGRDGDIIGYKDERDYLHFGIYRNEKVISKFGKWHVVEHDVDLIPCDWGNYADFFRKL